ncbi:MAG: monofunctional biosynthetic peptidoglycan transglycosylase [Desulfobacterales bacterium]|nr:monofunctional biosynthetic peptidoglycan transglycosylase [Desulfobacterales bacterium]MDD4463439.1 monofunctional biosynthetic peptidoglycan transglycosylase [Desulfobacterales bacterium]
MVTSRNRLGGRRFRRYAATALGVVMLVSMALTLPWRWLAPPTTAFILQDRLHHKGRIHQRWVPLNEISLALPIAVVAAEDQKFPHHHGFDFQSLSEALREDRQHPRGASTISQQLAKNLYLWPGRSLLRKALEAYFTVLIEFTWPKRRILEVYLNVVEFGPGVYGVDAASRLFFGKHSSRITSHEAALLAAVLPSPKRMSAHRPSEYVRKRAFEIEAAVRALGGPGYLAGL